MFVSDVSNRILGVNCYKHAIIPSNLLHFFYLILAYTVRVCISVSNSHKSYQKHSCQVKKKLPVKFIFAYLVGSLCLC